MHYFVFDRCLEAFGKYSAARNRIGWMLLVDVVVAAVVSFDYCYLDRRSAAVGGTASCVRVLAPCRGNLPAAAGDFSADTEMLASAAAAVVAVVVFCGSPTAPVQFSKPPGQVFRLLLGLPAQLHQGAPRTLACCYQKSYYYSTSPFASNHL